MQIFNFTNSQNRQSLNFGKKQKLNNSLILKNLQQ